MSEAMPPMPGFPTPEPPKKKSSTVWKVVAALAIIVAIGSQLPDKSSSTVATRSTLATSAPTETACLHKNAGLAATEKATSALQDGIAAAHAFDIDRMATDLHDASDLMLEASQAMSADPAISVPLQLASGTYEDAAQAVQDGRITAASNLMDQATGYVNEASQAVQNTTVSTC